MRLFQFTSLHKVYFKIKGFRLPGLKSIFFEECNLSKTKNVNRQKSSVICGVKKAALFVDSSSTRSQH